MNRHKSYSTILIIVLGMLLLYFWTGNIVLLYLAFSIGTLAIVSSNLRTLIIAGWMKLAHVLGWINSHILLSLVFYFLLTPIAVLNRFFSKDQKLILSKKEGSYFSDRNHEYSKEDMIKPW